MSNNNELFRMMTIEIIMEKASVYSAAKKTVSTLSILSMAWLVAAVILYTTGSSYDVVTPIIITFVLSFINCTLPTTRFFAENLIIKSKDIDDSDKLIVIREVQKRVEEKY